MQSCRINLGGNFCGHNPLSPRLELDVPPKKGVGGLPRIITLAIERLTAYFDSPRLLPTLDAANHSSRQQRSERRESCILVLSSLLKYCDLVTLKIGVPSGEGFQSFSLDFFVKQVGLHKRRVERAIADLKRAGILTSVQPRTKNEQGQVRGLPAIRCLSRHLFSALGLGVAFSLERKKAVKRSKQKSKESNGTAQAVGGLLLNSIRSVVAPPSKKPTASQSPLKDAETLEQRRLELRLQVEVMQERPDLSPERVREEVLRRLS